MRLIISDAPSVCGCQLGDIFSWISHNCINFCQNEDVTFGSRSETLFFGRPWSLKMFGKDYFAVSIAVSKLLLLVEQTLLIRRSTHVVIPQYPSLGVQSLTMKSIANIPHLLCCISSDIGSVSFPWSESLNCWHFTHPSAYSSTSRVLCRQLKLLCLNSIFANLKWPLSFESWAVPSKVDIHFLDTHVSFK